MSLIKPRKNTPATGARRLLASLLVIGLVMPLSRALGLPDDRVQAINIESDRASRNDKTGLTVYEGSVVMTQGSINIRADKITVYSTANKVSRIVCVGKPAHYQQQPEPDAALVIARANTIEYHLERDTITLRKNASLDQNGTVLKGEIINYDLKQELIEARGDEQGSGRIQMVIPPSQQLDGTDKTPEPAKATAPEVEAEAPAPDPSPAPAPASPGSPAS